MTLVLDRPTLRAHVEGVVMTVTLDRRPSNEIGPEMLADLEALVAHLERVVPRDGARAAGAPGPVRALVVTSAIPTAFSAGADLRALYAGILDRRARGVPREEQARELRSFLDRIHGVMDTLDALPITTIAAVHGFVFGGGFELALACDLIVADKSARFCFPELRLGLVPGFGGVPRLARDVGNAVVRDLLFTGRSLSASRLHAAGLVSQLVARGEAPRAARSLAEHVTKLDAETTARAKAFSKPIPRDALAREKDLFVEMFGSPVVEAALARFVASTDPRPYLP